MTQHLPVDLVGPLADTFLFHRMTAREELGRLFELSADCLSERHDVRATEVLGQTMTVRLELPRGGWRYFDGHVCRFEYLGVTPSRRYGRYRLVLRPWLWFLTRSADCRIFQDLTVPEVLKAVFREHGFSDFQESLYGEYRRWEYCVQYRETDFAFVSRLMEQEGIYYYFRHDFAEDRGRHTLVLADDYGAHARFPGYETVAFQRSTEAHPGEAERIGEWRISHEIEPEVYTLGDFDFTRPKAGLLVSRRAAPEAQPATGQVYDYPGEYLTRAEGEASVRTRMEVYDYPGKYRTRADGEAYVRTRMEELQAQHERAHATASARGLAVGNLFELRDHPRSDQNREYLVVSAVHTLRSVAYETELEPEAAGTPVYAGELTAMPSHLPFRSPRTTPRPVVEGPQTAIVVGPAGEKVWTDSYGRVKVRFHWDHRDTDAAGAAIPDERRSCWLRVSQNWAGQQWGELYLPHVGQEVIVSFLEGDPDRPLVTGRVYNADNMPPLDLPREKYRSVVARDHYGNQILFDGTPGGEHIMLHSPHHATTLELGKSVVSFTDSDKTEFTRGNTAGFQIGTQFEGFVGYKGEASLASTLEIKTGANFSYNFGRDVEYTLRDVYQTLDEDFIVDTDEKLSLIAGDKGKNSVFFAGDQEFELSVGDKKKSMDAASHARLKKYGVLALGVAGAGLAALSGELEHKYEGERGAGAADDAFGASVSGLFSLVALVAQVLWSVWPDASPTAVRHGDGKDAWLKLTATTAELDAKAAHTVNVGAAAGTINVGVRANNTVNIGHADSTLTLKGRTATIVGNTIHIG